MLFINYLLNYISFNAFKIFLLHGLILTNMDIGRVSCISLSFFFSLAGNCAFMWFLCW